MIVNLEDKSMEIEPRDVNYTLAAYARMYLFQSKNESPERIVMPMFESIPHPYNAGESIPIVYVPDTSPEALRIVQDGGNVPETTPESEAEADEKEAEYETMKARIAELENMVNGAMLSPEEQAEKSLNAPEPISPARAMLAEQEAETQLEPETSTEDEAAREEAIASIQPTPERLAAAKAPDVVLPPGTATDYGGSRSAADQKRIARDLLPEPDIEEDKEIDASEIAEHAKGQDEAE